MGEGGEFLWGCRSRVSKANSRSGWVCLLEEVLIDVIEDLTKMHQTCLTFATTSLGMLQLSSYFGGSCFA